MSSENESVAVSIPAGDAVILGELVLPDGAKGVVLFAHGSGSGRGSTRNNLVAGHLRQVGFGTLLVDLLTADEMELDSRTGRLRFDIELLSKRVLAASQWLDTDPRTSGLALGYFGASTGAAAALLAAAELGGKVNAIVSRGGRPDLAIDCLPKVDAPTLLIVGGADVPVIPLNQEALEELRCDKELIVVPSAGHLFEEDGAMEAVSSHATRWFLRYMDPAGEKGKA
ncbi:MAG: dienelactone hydrolase family protein [Gemmatimonadaceae bacterium]